VGSFLLRPRRKSVRKLHYGAQWSSRLKKERIRGAERILKKEREAEAAAVSVAICPAPTLRRRVNGLSGMQVEEVEVTVLFTVAAGVTDAVFGINVLASADGQDLVPVGTSLSDGQMFVGPNAGPFLPMVPAVAASIGVVDDDAATAAATLVWLHVIVDHQIVTAIFNNRTALTVFGMPRGTATARAWSSSGWTGRGSFRRRWRGGRSRGSESSICGYISCLWKQCYIHKKYFLRCTISRPKIICFIHKNLFTHKHVIVQ
jgi:hypothetical protein